MENGAGNSDYAKVEESRVNDQVSDLQMNENQDTILDGSNESDGDEVFEETVEPDTPTVVAGNSLIIQDRNVQLTGTLKSNIVSEEVEEVFETPHAPPSARAEFLMSALQPDDKEIDTEEVATSEMNGLMDVSKEIVNSPSTLKTDHPYGEEVNEELVESLEKLETGTSDNVTFVEASTSQRSEIVETDTREDSNSEMSGTIHPVEIRGAETDAEKPDLKGYIEATYGNEDANNVEGHHIDPEKPENGAINHVNHETRKMSYADTLKGRLIETSLETDVANGSKGSDAGRRSESESNGDILHNGEQENGKNLSADLQCEQLKEDPSSKQEEFSNSCANVGDGKITKLEEIFSDNVQLPEVVSHDVDVGETKDTDTAASFVIHNAEESSEIDIDVPPVVEDSAAEEVDINSSKLLVEVSKSSEPQLVDGNVEVSTYSQVPEREGVSDDKKDQCFSVNKDQEVGPIAGIHEPVSQAPKVQEPVSQDPKVQEPVLQEASVNGEREIKPDADIPSSSGNTVPSRPAGLGSTAPLLEPSSSQKNSGDKEFVSRSTADTSNTSATPARPAGLGAAAPLLEPASRVVQQPRVNGAISQTQNQVAEDPTNGEAEEFDETREKLQMIRVKFLRLAHRLGQTPHNVVVAQVLYRLGLAEQLRGRSGSRVAAFSFDRASAMAEQLEAAGQEPLDFTCTIMVLGKSGVGKSATINSIFDEVMFGTDAFQLGTKKVQDIVGTVQGIRVRVIDTPGLLPSWSDQRQNEKILRSVKNFIKKTPPDIVLYLDRLDMQSRDFGDMPLLRTITEIFGPSIWFNAIVVLTHAASAPPEGPNGTTTSYDMFVTQRSHVVQQAIRQAAGDMRLMNPVSLVENHSACRTNRAGQRVLPNGQVWKPHLLLLSFASKILAEANTLLKLQDSPPGRPFAPRTRSPPLPFLLSSLLQSRPEVKLPSEQFGDDDDAIGDDLDSSDSEDESEYDELPPFKSLTKAQLEKLTKEQKKAYYDELEYREKLFMKKQLKEEKKRRKMMKKMQEAVRDLPETDYGQNVEEEAIGAASVPVPIPDLVLPASFDADNPTHRYRSLDSSNPWLVRAVLEPNGWDHDIGYEGVNVERLFVVKNRVPISFSGHISKDKKDANLQMEIASSVKDGKGKATSLGFDMQSVGKDMAYTLRSESRFINHKINKAAAGLSATLMGDVLTGGVKLEDKLIIGKRGQLVVSGGAMYGRGDVAYGGSLEATLRDKDHPLGRFLSTLGLSVMDWHGDLAIGCNSQTQIPIGRHTNLIGRVNINNRGSGQVSLRINSSEQLQIVLVGLIPLVKKILGYSQQVQYG